MADQTMFAQKLLVAIVYLSHIFMQPSDALICGQLEGVDCVILARYAVDGEVQGLPDGASRDSNTSPMHRHDRQHTINPTNINFRANMWALKEEGCHLVLASTACGSLRENIHPGELGAWVPAVNLDPTASVHC
jgi:5'-methylthioadenosine phosphorylase